MSAVDRTRYAAKLFADIASPPMSFSSSPKDGAFGCPWQPVIGNTGLRAQLASDLGAAVRPHMPNRIVGGDAGGLHSRHDAMLAAEVGADYVMFGEPDAAATFPRVGSGHPSL